MISENSEIDFGNQRIFVGLDVHQKSWSVTLRTKFLELKTFSMNPVPEDLKNYLEKNYPGGKYISVYEAGFSGYWIHRRLTKLGIDNIIVNPADVPTKSKERISKNDRVDSRKLARELEGGRLTANYIPTEYHQELRSLSRLRMQLVKDQVRIKNRIKGLLMFYGKQIPENYQIHNWSGNFIKYLETIKFNTAAGKQTLALYLEELKQKRIKTAEILRSLREYAAEEGFKETIDNLTSVPGIGFITAITLYTELIEIKRFESLDELSSYVGLVPSVVSSAEKEHVLGISQRHNIYLRNMLIESAWTAVRKDPALTLRFSQLTGRMSKQRAIIRIARKLLSRIRFVWKNNKRYKMLIDRKQTEET